MSYRLGIDVGGTFTDLLLFNDGTGEMLLIKTPSTPTDQSIGVLNGIRKIADQAGLSAEEIKLILHGTTVATNAILEGKGALVGLITTRGFEQILHVARSQTPGPLAGWIIMQKPDPLAPLHLTRSVSARISARGEEMEPLDEIEARDFIRELHERGIQALTVSLINSFANPAHERRIRDLAAEMYPELPVTISTDILPEFREYERTLTTVMNSYVRPKMNSYLSGIETKLHEAKLEPTVNILRSDGGVMSLDAGKRSPVNTLLSGPSGGVVAASYIGELAGFKDVLSFDMGGTSTDVAISTGGQPNLVRETRIGYYPVKVSSVDVRSVGAGGGSIAHVPLTGALRVGPQSAGAEPGPAAYGAGGTEPTVTDANVVLGHLPPSLLGGEMKLDIHAARAAVQKTASALELSVEDAAQGIIDIVNENMFGALRLVTVQRGLDPRDFCLVAFGGAGPLHANALARLAGSWPVIIPPTPGVLSALGFLHSDIRNEFSQTLIQTQDKVDNHLIKQTLLGLADQAREWLIKEGIPTDRQHVDYEVDVRYYRQGYEFPIPVDLSQFDIETGVEKMVGDFKEVHGRNYGFNIDSLIEIVNLRAIGVGLVRKVELPKFDTDGSDVSQAVVEKHRIYFQGGFLDTPIYDRKQLRPGNVVRGPAIITQADSTTVILPDHYGEVDPYLNVLIRPNGLSLSANVKLDKITLDIIENALRNARHEMDAVVFRSAMSPVIREQHDEFPMICTRDGRMVVGQFGSYIAGFLGEWKRGIYEGDVFLCSDPYKCRAAISHINDWMVLLPIFYQGEHVAWASQFGHTLDIGGPVPGSLPTHATSIYGEGTRIPPIKLFERGKLNEDVLDLILNNSRTPTMNYFDLLAIVAGCRTAEKRVVELCDRFGKETVLESFEALLERTYKAMSQLIVNNLPEHKISFKDYVDDDGRGNGPYKMKLTIWREGNQGFFDWTGTDPQAPGPINFYLSEEMFKMFIGVYLIMVFDPQILFNDGFYPLLHIILPEGSLLRPKFPAALGCRTHALARLFDVLGGALGRQAPELSTAAGYGTSPYLLYNGYDENGEFFHLMEITYGGIPGRPMGDGMDAHSWWPLFENIPTEYLESYYPVTVLEYGSLIDSGGAGYHRGGNAVHKVYRFEVDGEIAIHDDRERSQPWGILGGLPGACSSKLLVRNNGEQVPLPSKISQVRVGAGDVLIYRTAGGGGWKDPLDRPAEKVQKDVKSKLVSVEKAQSDYGVILDPAMLEIQQKASEDLRERMRKERGPVPMFTFGPTPEPIGVVREREAPVKRSVASTAVGGDGQEMGSTAAAGQPIEVRSGRC